MKVSDLLDPQKMGELEERFRPLTDEDVNNARKALEARGMILKPRTAFICNGKKTRSQIFKRSNFNKNK